MGLQFIPIRPLPWSPPAATPRGPRLDGDAQQVQRVLRALEAAVQREVGADWPAADWLRELQLSDHEAVAAIAPGLQGFGAQAAEAAFQTLRRLLPDTDIYVRQAPA